MAIPLATHSSLPQWIFYLGSQISNENLIAGSSVLEAAYYSSVKTCSSGAYRSVKWIRETATNYLREIQALFNALNAGAILYYTFKLASEIRAKVGYINPNSNAQFALLNLAIVMTVSAIGWQQFSKTPFTPPETMEVEEERQVFVSAGTTVIFDGEPIVLDADTEFTVEEKVSIQVSKNPIFQQRVTLGLNVAKSVLSIALACLTGNRFWLVVSVIGSGYSMMKNAGLQWISFSRNFPLTSPEIPIQGAEVTYQMLALPPSSSKRDKCAVCFLGESEDEPKPDMAFCTYHVFHQECISECVNKESQVFLDAGLFEKVTTKKYTNGIHTGTTHDYTVTIPEKNIPNCLLCRAYPYQNRFVIKIDDAWHGVFDAKVKVKRAQDNQPLFEKLYAVYNIAQAGLAFLQQYPELAATIFKIRKVLLMADIIGLGFTLHYLARRVKEKLKIENSMTFNLAALVTVVATGVFSYFAVTKINTYMQSALVLKELMKGLQLSPNFGDVTSIGWSNPYTQKLIQGLYVSRLISMIGLSFFSKQKWINAMSMVSQAFGLVSVSNVPFFEIARSLQWPNGMKSNLKQLNVTSTFMLDPSCTKESLHLQSALQSTFNYLGNLFDKSSWSSFWEVNKDRFGNETSRRLKYAVQLQKTLIDKCACSLPVSLYGHTMSAIDAIHGFAGVDF